MGQGSSDLVQQEGLDMRGIRSASHEQIMQTWNVIEMIRNETNGYALSEIRFRALIKTCGFFDAVFVERYDVAFDEIVFTLFRRLIQNDHVNGLIVGTLVTVLSNTSIETKFAILFRSFTLNRGDTIDQVSVEICMKTLYDAVFTHVCAPKRGETECTDRLSSSGGYLPFDAFLKSMLKIASKARQVREKKGPMIVGGVKSNSADIAAAETKRGAAPSKDTGDSSANRPFRYSVKKMVYVFSQSPNLKCWNDVLSNNAALGPVALSRHSKGPLAPRSVRVSHPISRHTIKNDAPRPGFLGSSKYMSSAWRVALSNRAYWLPFLADKDTKKRCRELQDVQVKLVERQKHLEALQNRFPKLEKALENELDLDVEVRIQRRDRMTTLLRDMEFTRDDIARLCRQQHVIEKSTTLRAKYDAYWSALQKKKLYFNALNETVSRISDPQRIFVGELLARSHIVQRI
eukprot:g5270.t1